jgi:thiol-disulfide isomerase/thioredoxin
MKLAVLLVLVAAGSAAAEPLDAAITRAKDAGKPLVVEIGATWCGPCKVFARDVLPDPSVKDALEDVVFVRYDADVDGDGKAAAKRLRATAFPTFIVLGGTQERFRRTGMHPVPAFLQLLADAAGALESVETMHAKLKASPEDIGLRLMAARWYRSRGLPREALAHFAAVAAHPKTKPTERRVATAAAAHLRRTLRWRQELIDDAVALVRADPAHASPDDVIVATVGSTLPPDEAKALVTAVLEAQTESARRNTFVYIALAAGATDAALAAAKLNVTGDRSGQLLDTLAEAHHVRGERDAALAIEDEALGLSRGAPHEKTLIRNRKRFATSRQDARDVKDARGRADALRTRFETVDALDPAPEGRDDDDEEDRKRMSAGTEAQVALVASVTKQCRRWAGETPLLYARAFLKADRIASVTVFTDGSAAPALTACVKRILDGAALPRISRSGGSERLLKIYFKPANGEQ